MFWALTLTAAMLIVVLTFTGAYLTGRHALRKAGYTLPPASVRDAWRALVDDR